MAKRERRNPEWQALVAEHQILKRKLQSKSEALLIISKDLDYARSERDQFKLMGEKLQMKCQAFKKQQADFPLTSDTTKLIQMLKDMKNQKLQCQKQSEVLQQKLNEALGDVKLLREKFARQTVGDEGIGARHFPLHEREKLVAELEESQQQCAYWKKEYENQEDTLEEARSEQEIFKHKADRLNQEMSYLLTGDKKRIIDIDALCMENKYLQDRITQCQAEKNSLHAQLTKYKAVLSSRKASKSDLIKPAGELRSAGLVVSPKQLKFLLSNGSAQSSPQQVSDLQSITSALLETINDKNLALHHLRNTNKILGNRVSDLERKLKTLEVAGLWNMHNAALDTSPGTLSTLDLHCDVTPMTQNGKPPTENGDGAENAKTHQNNGIAGEEDDDVTPTADDVTLTGSDVTSSSGDEFLSSLGSRLSRLNTADEYRGHVGKLVSVTSNSPDGSLATLSDGGEFIGSRSAPILEELDEGGTLGEGSTILEDFKEVEDAGGIDNRRELDDEENLERRVGSSMPGGIKSSPGVFQEDYDKDESETSGGTEENEDLGASRIHEGEPTISEHDGKEEKGETSEESNDNYNPETQEEISEGENKTAISGDFSSEEENNKNPQQNQALNSKELKDRAAELSRVELDLTPQSEFFTPPQSDHATPVADEAPLPCNQALAMLSGNF